MTPSGQCQWSPCGSHASVDGGVVVFGGTGTVVVVFTGGGVVGSGTPDGQCQWSSCGTHSPTGVDADAFVVVLTGGGVVGWGTPDGQCQWSSWGSQVPTADDAEEADVETGGGVVGTGTPDGQCQWSPCGSHVPTADDWVVVVDGYGSQCPYRLSVPLRICAMNKNTHNDRRAGCRGNQSGTAAGSASMKLSGRWWS